MKILVINSLYEPHIGGGAEIIVQQQANGLAKAGCEVKVLTVSTSNQIKLAQEYNPTIYECRYKNIYFHFNSKNQPDWKKVLWHTQDIYNVRMANYLNKIINQFRPQVVISHNLLGWSSIVWQTVAKQKIPIIQVLHDLYSICPKTTMFKNNSICREQCTSCSLLRLPHRYLSNKVTAVVGVSNFVLQKHLQLEYFNNVPIKQVIYNTRSSNSLGISDNHDTSEFLSDYNKNEITIGFIGRLDQSKGIELLLETFTKPALKKINLLVAGKGEDSYEQNLKLRFKKNNIFFLGRVKPVDFYSKVDIVVVPSLWNDTLPGVVYEAMAFGKPVVASKRGGIVEMIENNKNGILFEPNNPDEIFNSILYLINDKKKLIYFSKAAKDSANKYLNTDLWIQKYIDLCAEVSIK